MDGCSRNLKTISLIEEHQNVKFMATLCFTHCGNNVRHEAGFPVLYRFWTIFQKIFAYSEKANNIWKEEIGVSWKTFTENRWYSQYEVFDPIP
jgi:hypothetical protein